MTEALVFVILDSDMEILSANGQIGGSRLQYIIYMDESNDEGPYYGNFYGGALVRSKDYMRVVDLLESTKVKNNMLGEVKWQKVTLNYLEKYMDLIDVFFDLIEMDIIKLRVMFTQNNREAINLTQEQRASEYEMLYYQFFKHAFGLRYSNMSKSSDISLRIYFDELPVAPQKATKFKEFIERLQYTKEFSEARLKINKEDVTEVKSNQHVLLQYMDIVLGAMYFRLNQFHKVKPEGEKRRGKRTVAKDNLYQHINRRIRKIYPNFNIGVSTGAIRITDRWHHPYRHWLFIPNEHRVLPEYKKETPSLLHIGLSGT
ncbi:DUF3800 domain-containing protein [Paenibacillus spongiae]|uniref:DUF3800 domain-containing protein n=1 Tax=Paenibacillus spongiae TaxID=2909671 RepID=A0ABY5SEN4_9BACL|nr:DUF3800 domain-containing protein [Paenibacillus spongiae]UVI31227.1 DUF3800 domain-containing protein [Paenibacillus spongiae]